MADKSKKISVNAMERVIKDSGDAAVTKDWHGNELIIRRRLGLVDMMNFVAGVVQTCFVGEEKVYSPEVRDFAIRCGLLEIYANFTLPSSVEKRYEFVYGCDAVDAVMAEIDHTQYILILDAIEEKLQHMADAHIEAVNRHIDELFSSFEALESKLSEVFGGIGEDDMAGIVKALQSGTLDEEKLVNAYFDARSKQPKPDEEEE